MVLIKKMAILQNKKTKEKMVLLVEPILDMTEREIEKEYLEANNECWSLLKIDDSKTHLVSITEGVDNITLDGMVLLPSKSDPQVTVYVTPGGRWACESQSGISFLKTGDKVEVSGSAWYFINFAPETDLVEISRYTASASNVVATFEVSENNEFVSLKLIVNKIKYELKHRSHHGLMLVLARKRLLDINAGVCDEGQGWISKEALARSLGLKETHVNIHIYRFRKQFVTLIPSEYKHLQLVETRRGELRFASRLIEIKDG